MVNYKLGDIIQFRNTENIFMKLVALHNFIYYRKEKDYKKYRGGATHSAIVTKIDKETIGLSEAVGKPFQEFQYEKWWLDARIDEGKAWIRRPKVKITNVKKHTEKYLNKKYDWFSIWGIFLKSVFGIKSKIANKFKGDNYLICSEGALRILYDASDKQIDLTTEWQKETDFIPPICIDLSNQFVDGE